MTQSHNAPILHVGSLEIDLASYRALRNGEPVHLTRTEWALLQELILHRGQVLTYRTLLQRVWGEVYGNESDYVHTYVRRLRRKLEDDPANPQYLLNEPGLGYRFDIPPNAPTIPTTPPTSAAHNTGVKRRAVNPLPQDVRERYVGRTTEQAEITALLLDKTRLISIYGRGGVGKTALACKVLGDLQVATVGLDGMVYLSTLSTGITLDRILADFDRLLDVEPVHSDPKMPPAQKVTGLLEKLASGNYVLLLDNLETLQDPTTSALIDPELQTFMEVILQQGSTLRILVTSREPLTLPRSLKQWERLIPLETGLPLDEAINLLRVCDSDGMAGLRDAPTDQLRAIAEATRGFPRALEAIVGLLLEDKLLRLENLLQDPALLTGEINTLIVNLAIERLSPEAQRVLEIVALLGHPAPQAAIEFLQAAYTETGSNTVHMLLNRLVRAYFLSYNRANQTFAMHPADQAYCYQRIPTGTLTDITTTPPPYSRPALHYRAASFFRMQRKPRSEWQSIDDLTPHLTEFEHLAKASDYETAAELLQSFDDVLNRWGYYRSLIELFEKLPKPIIIELIKRRHLIGLGEAYQAVGRMVEAKQWYTQVYTLAQRQHDNEAEGAVLNSLGWLDYERGEFDSSIEFWEQALEIFRRIADRRGEGNALGGLGWVDNLLGRYDQAIDYLNQALDIFREIDDKRGIGINQGDLGFVQAMLGNLTDSVVNLRTALTIANQIDAPREQSYKGGYLAMTLLHAGKLVEAHEAITQARHVNVASNNHFVAVIQAIILARLGDSEAAQTAFREAIRSADELLTPTNWLYAPLYTRGLAYAGLALFGHSDLQNAQTDYATAYKRCSAAGVVESNRRLLEALVRCPGGDMLQSLVAALNVGR